ncbi:MAG: ABC transporter permease [Candidatus Nanopelagicales bacterium]
MLSFAVRRLLYSIPVILVGSFILFWAVRSAFDPLVKIRAIRDPEVIARETERLGLDQGIIVQYWRWLTGFLTGDWGTSSRTSGDVLPMIQSALTVTLQLLIWSLIFATIAAVLVGVWSALRQYSPSDYALTGLAYVGLAIPAFWFGLILIQFLAVWPQQLLGWSEPPFYFIGLSSVDEEGSLLDTARHMVLPILALTVGLVAVWSRFTRTSMLDALSSDYVRTARAKGVPQHRVVINHALRNAWGPLITVIAIDSALLIGGLLVTEQVFSIPGMGRLFLDSLLAGDVFVLMPWMLLVATAVILLNFLADIAHALLDPRVRLT